MTSTKSMEQLLAAPLALQQDTATLIENFESSFKVPAEAYARLRLAGYSLDDAIKFNRITDEKKDRHKSPVDRFIDRLVENGILANDSITCTRAEGIAGIIALGLKLRSVDNKLTPSSQTSNLDSCRI